MNGKPQKYVRIARRALGISNIPRLFYSIEPGNWVLNWVAHYVTAYTAKNTDLKTEITHHIPSSAVGDLLHFGSLWDTRAIFLTSGATQLIRYNRIITTIFHGEHEQSGDFANALNTAIVNQDSLSRVVTASQMMKGRLLSWGIAAEKVVCIPLGVDLQHFKPISNEEKRAMRTELGIPEDAICIGSFQKDGSGWGEGNDPKLIKGPDIFLDVVEALAREYNIFVLLTGPSRGYVKKGLEARGIPYLHEMLDDYLEIPGYYQCLDLYLMTSREEGGPQCVLEAPACGVPLVATRTGLTADIHTDGITALLCDVEDTNRITMAAKRLIEDAELRKQIRANSLNNIQPYDWESIAMRYYHEVYQPILEEMGSA